MRRWPACLAIACAGAGYVGYSAVRRLGWTTQIPARDLLATALGAPQRALEGVSYAALVENLRRRELTWVETTLLVALLHADLIEADPSYDFDPDRGLWDQAARAVARSLLASGETLPASAPARCFAWTSWRMSRGRGRQQAAGHALCSAAALAQNLDDLRPRGDGD